MYWTTQYASLWNAKWPHDPNNPDTYWGYVLTMGSSEANLYASWNARDYLQGKFMMTDRSVEKNPRVLYMRAKLSPKDSPNAFTPVAFYSQDTHYSLIKATAVMEISTFYQIGSTEYPGQCPLAGTNGDWPLEVPSLSTGSVDVDQLVQLVEFFAKKGYPSLIILNYGTTFKGAYDDVKAATDRIMPILSRYGLNQRIIVVYRTRISYHTRMVHTVRVRYVPYAYGMFFCTIRVWLYRMRICFTQHKTFP